MEDLTSKQRAQLRGLANSIDTILHVGKDGIGDNLVKQADDALEARELIKGKVLENSLLSSREAASKSSLCSMLFTLAFSPSATLAIRIFKSCIYA